MGEGELIKQGSEEKILGLWNPVEIPASVKETEMFQRDKKIGFDEVTVWSLPEDVRSHIVIVGAHKGVTHLLATFRRSDVHKDQPIVIFARKQPGISD
jgi:hypothetical protein